ncbi:hypothetical protein [uncultured Olegusella sp.]|uniref:hypothetical protein n=1 Tax=uncultured Olegusella sp. TaxID=1979846 RepID=UPI0026080FF0|nr:hypothetical protein [uncultured Olegusella sp.]
MKIKSAYKKFECSGGVGKLQFEVTPTAKDAGELSRLQLLSMPVELSIEPIQDELPFEEQENKAMEAQNCTIYELPGTQVVSITSDVVVLDGVPNLDAVAQLISKVLGHADCYIDAYCDDYGLTRKEFFDIWHKVQAFLEHKAHENTPIEE